MKEKMYTIDKTLEQEKDLQVKIQKQEEELAILAQVVGADFDMKVSFGKMGQGSFFNPEDSSITLDPLIIVEGKDWLAEFVAGHEGGHRAITRSLEQIGLKKEKAIELYKKIGFGYLSNCIEDCADNDWVGQMFEKFKQASDKNYKEQFEQENAVMTTPEISQMIGMLGYTPKFAQFGSEILRKWATGKYSKKLDPEVEKAIKKTEEHFEKAWQEIPSEYSKELARIASARERFRIIFEKVLPVFEDLVKQDIDQEKMRELANKMMQDQMNQPKEGTGEPQAGEGEGSALPDALRKELEKLQKENMEKQLDELEKQLDELNQQLENPDLSDEQKKEIKKKIKDLMGIKDGIESGEINTVPWDQLSDELKEKLQELYNKLPKDIREEMQKKAQKTLEKIDDELIKDSRGKIQEDGTPLTHDEVRQAEKEHQEQKKQEENKIKEIKESKKMQDQVEARLQGELNDYDRIYKEVAPIVDELYQRIHKVFLSQRHPRWQKGHASGHRLDLAKVMQFQADKAQHDKLWERKTIPKKIDYRFTLLVDLSGSMSGENIKQTFRGVVVLAEVLNLLGIKTEIIGFQDVNIIYKDFQTELSPEIRRKMAIMRKEVDDNGEHNQAAYNSDGYCLQEASERLQKNKGKDNFIVVFSDGSPVPDEAHAGDEYDLHNVVEKIRKTTKQKLIGVGLGQGTGHVSDYYPVSLPNLDIKKIVQALGDLLEDMIKFPAKYQ